MYAQNRPRFILSSERVLFLFLFLCVCVFVFIFLGLVFFFFLVTHVNSKGKIPSTGGLEEGQTHNGASRRTAIPTHHTTD